MGDESHHDVDRFVGQVPKESRFPVVASTGGEAGVGGALQRPVGRGLDAVVQWGVEGAQGIQCSVPGVDQPAVAHRMDIVGCPDGSNASDAAVDSSSGAHLANWS